MSKVQSMISATHAESGDNVKLAADRVIFLLDDALGTKIIYSNDGATQKDMIVTENRAAIRAEADNTIEVTKTGAAALDINANRIYSIIAEGTGSKISYNDEGVIPEDIIVDENPGALETAIEAL